jgi:hypothetical protein
MGTFEIAATVTFLRFAFLGNSAEYRNLFCNIFAAARRASPLTLIRGFFKQLKIAAAFSAFIFKNRHNYYLYYSPKANRGEWIRTTDLLVPNQAL